MSRKSIALRFITRFMGNPLLSSLMKYTGNPLKNRKWVFIVGCYNSGTTLLDEILSSHPDFSGLNEEGVMLTDSLPRPEDFAWRRMWWKCEEQMMIPPGTESAVADVVKRHWSHFYKSQNKLLLEKSISNTPRIMFFERHFQPAYFIHIVRNGYAVSEGIRRKADVMSENPLNLPKEYPIEWCAAQWKRNLEVVTGYRPKLKHFMEISYEQLTEDPDGIMAKVCEFVGASPFTRSLKDTSFEVHRQTEQIVNMNQRSIKSLNNDQIAAINGIAGDFLKRYGYFINKA